MGGSGNKNNTCGFANAYDNILESCVSPSQSATINVKIMLKWQTINTFW